MVAIYARPAEDRCAGDGGFTVAEVIVSFVLFVVVATAATTGVINSLQSAHASQRRVDAANVAQSFIASAQANSASATVESGKSYEANVLGEQFTVKRWITFFPPDGTPGGTQCSPGATFTVNVTVDNADGEFLARSDSVVAC